MRSFSDILPGRVPTQAQSLFDGAFAKLWRLLDERNTVVHGTWSDASNAPVLGDMNARKGAMTLHASEVRRVAKQLRAARKLLLLLCHDYRPVAAGNKKRPAGTVAALSARV
jgi:hypothetical protein